MSTTKEKLNYLENIAELQVLSSDEIEAVGQQTHMMRYPAGHLFYMPEDSGEVLFILKEGRVQLYSISPDGRKLVVAILQPGAIFGHMALVGQHMHNTFAQAIDNCIICIWNREDVERALVEKPQLALRFLEAVGQRLTQTEERLLEASFQKIPTRLANLLLRLEKEQGNEGYLKGYTHQYFADMLGTYRETATQTLNEFKNQKLIQIRRKSIEILNRDGLKQIAESK